jgi:hypothetical protein
VQADAHQIGNEQTQDSQNQADRVKDEVAEDRDAD